MKGRRKEGVKGDGGDDGGNSNSNDGNGYT